MIRHDLIRHVHQVLHQVWDPIQISDVPEIADNEYDDYVGGVLHLVEKNPPEGAIVDHLLTIEREELGLPGDAARARRAARALLALGKR
jgi:hypothetical protein